MIELITGLPGNGKTLFTIAQVKAQAERENRPVYYHGIPELSLPWELLDDPKNWASVPPGAIVVIDEAQKTFRNRSLGSVPPQFVTDLETHRHLGIDLVLITQHPSLVDPAVRRLSGRHRHLVRIWGMEASTVHKWDSVKDNCDKARADSEKTKWGFDKSVYAYYKSAEQHTMKRTVPFRVKMLFCLPFLLLAAGYGVYAIAVKPKIAPAAQAQVANPFAHPGQSVPLVSAQAAKFDPISDARHFVDQATPRVEGLQHTAPKYDSLTAPTAVPVPSMCVQLGSVNDRKPVRCQCYSQQATKLDVPFNMCLEFARSGFFREFDADRARQSDERTASSVAVMDRLPDQPISRSESSALSLAFNDTREAPRPAPVAPRGQERERSAEVPKESLYVR
jgi:zona occludens toxin